MGSIRAMAMAGRLVCLIAIALALNSGDADGAPLLNPELVEFSDISDLGESSAVAEGGEDIAAVADYKSTKTKYEGLIKKVRTQHDLTLCRTGRKPNSPMLKFQLKRAKSKLKKQLTKMPAKAQKKAAKKKLKKKLKKAKKAKKKAKKAKKKAKRRREKKSAMKMT